MRLNTDIIFRQLEKKFTAQKTGPDIENLVVLRPIFADGVSEYEKNRAYIGRPDQFLVPTKRVNSLLICVGKHLPSSLDTKQCSVITLPKENDLFRVMNYLTEVFDRFDRWEEELQQILEQDANITKMLECSVPILENPMSLCNNQLALEAVVGPEGTSGISSPGPVPEEYFMEFANFHSENIARREPFTYSFMGMNSYSINLYKQDTYLGLITIGDANKPITHADKKLFQYLFKFVSRAAEEQIHGMSGQFITLKSIVTDLVNSVSVKPETVRHILEVENIEKDTQWVCAVVVLGSGTGSLSATYFSSLLEQYIGRSFGIYHEPYIVICYTVKDKDVQMDPSTLAFENLLKKLGMHAGVSNPFGDIGKIRQYYRQAVQTLKTGKLYLGEGTLFHFNEIALSYMVKNSMGELDAECVIPTELLRLWARRQDADKNSGAVDYWNTLKTYLDNEMNAAKTARQLYIHRTTLQIRLDKITKKIRLYTPEERLYVRNCMYFLELTNMDGEE